MGTNYYVRLGSGNRCDKCGRCDEEELLHLGKSSSGWCFGLRVYPDKGIANLEDWLAILAQPTTSAFSEYDLKTALPKYEVIGNIIARHVSDTAASAVSFTEDFLSRNNAIRGPGNLLRHRLGEHCIGHGAGTWDLIVGEFC